VLADLRPLACDHQAERAAVVSASETVQGAVGGQPGLTDRRPGRGRIRQCVGCARSPSGTPSPVYVIPKLPAMAGADHLAPPAKILRPRWTAHPTTAVPLPAVHAVRMQKRRLCVSWPWRWPLRARPALASG